MEIVTVPQDPNTANPIVTFKMLHLVEAMRNIKEGSSVKWTYSEIGGYYQDFCTKQHYGWLKFSHEKAPELTADIFANMWNMNAQLIERPMIQEMMHIYASNPDDCSAVYKRIRDAQQHIISGAFRIDNNWDVYVEMELRMPAMKNAELAIRDVLLQLCTENHPDVHMSRQMLGDRFNNALVAATENMTAEDHAPSDRIEKMHHFSAWGIHKNMYFRPARTFHIPRERAHYVRTQRDGSRPNNHRAQNFRVILTTL